jgi:hypothetical protein
MGKFINNSDESKSRKKDQTVTVPFYTNSSNLDDLEAAVESWPASYTCTINSVSQSSDVVDGEFTYRARGANRTDVERRIERSGLKGITLRRPKTEQHDA